MEKKEFIPKKNDLKYLNGYYYNKPEYYNKLKEYYKNNDIETYNKYFENINTKTDTKCPFCSSINSFQTYKKISAIGLILIIVGIVILPITLVIAFIFAQNKELSEWILIIGGSSGIALFIWGFYEKQSHTFCNKCKTWIN